jgi:hypothetical protein
LPDLTFKGLIAGQIMHPSGSHRRTATRTNH